MDISRLKKLFAGVSAVVISLTQVGNVFAAYSDVPAGVWYADAVQAFTSAGYLDASQTMFRGGDNANRAEFTKLVVELNGGILSTPPAVPSFDDVPTGAWYYGYMEEAAKEGWVKGDNNCYGTHPCYARPSDNINRAEAAALIVRAFGLTATGDAPSFVDVPAGQWYTSAVQTAADHCVLQGDDTTGRARPSDFMNRAEMVVMLHRVDQNLTFGVDCGTSTKLTPAIKSVDMLDATTVEVTFNTKVDSGAEVDASHYSVSGTASPTVSSVKAVDSTTADLTLSSATTAGASYTLSVQDMKTSDGKTFSDTKSFTGYSTIAQGNGTLEVSLSSTNPTGDTVPRGANGVVMASFDLTASCDDSVTLQNLTVLHEGFGSSTDIDGVYATVNGARVTRRRTIDSQNQTADIRFVKPLTIDACKSTTVDVVADFDSTAQVAGEHDLAIELPTDILSNAKAVKGNFPLRGNTFKVGAVTSGQVTVSYRTVSPSQVTVGDTKDLLGRFEVDANSVEDQTIYSATLYQNGSAKDGDVTNLMIRRSDGTVVTNTVAATVGNYATFVFNPPLTVLEGDKLTFDVVGDVVSGSANTVQFEFEEASDLFAVGSLYGYGVNGQLYGSQVADSGTATPVTIKAGEFTVEIDGPTQQNFTKSQTSANIANITMSTAADAIDLRHLYIAIQGQTSTGAGLAANSTTDDNINDIISNVQLRDAKTGQSISGVRLTNSGTDFATGTTSNATYQIYRFDDFTVTNSDTWNLLVNFSDNGASAHPLDGDKFRAAVCTQTTSSTTGCDFGGLGSLTTATMTYNMEVKGLTTGDDVTDVRPGGSLVGNFQLIATPSLTVAVQTIGSTGTAVKNSKNINLLRFQAQGGKAEDVLFTGAIFRAQSGSLLNGQNYALWVDTDGDGVVDTILQKGVAAQNNQISFDQLAGGGYVIPAQGTVTFEVHADIAANLTNDGLLLAFDTGSSVTYLSAEEVTNGSSLSGLETIAPNGTKTCTSTCQIVTTVAWSKLWSLVSQGDLYVTADTNPRSHQLLGGTVGDPVLALDFRASNEDIAVTNLQLNSSGGTANSVESLLLYKQGETTPFATATNAGCGTDKTLHQNPMDGSVTTTFCVAMNNQQFVVKSGTDTHITVVPRMKSDNDGATSGDKVQIWLTKQAIADNSALSGAVLATGLQSSNPLNANRGGTTDSGAIFIGTNTLAANNNIVGLLNQTVLSKITSIANASSDADGTAVPSGTNPIGEFSFTAATNNNTLNGTNNATLSGVVFNVNATNVAINPTSFVLFNNLNQNTSAACTPYLTDGATQIQTSASGSFVVDCRSLIHSGVDTKIQSGMTQTYTLQANVTNPKVSSTSTSGLQVALQNFSSISNTTYGPTSTRSHIDWFDQDQTGHDFTWVENGSTVIKGTSYTK